MTRMGTGYWSKDGQRLSPVLLTNSDSAENMKVAQVLADQLERAAWRRPVPAALRRRRSLRTAGRQLGLLRAAALLPWHGLREHGAVPQQVLCAAGRACALVRAQLVPLPES